jgi:hypothetical protein
LTSGNKSERHEMIRESHPWKAEICKSSRYLERLRSQRHNLSSHQCFCVEKHTFLSFYAIRKLLEAKKLSDECRSQQVVLTTYPCTGKPITHFNWHRSDEHFDFTNPTVDQWTVLNLCHQFVHSYVFHVVPGEPGGLAGLMVASDRQKASSLIKLDIGSTISLFDSVAQDDVVSSQWHRDPVTGKETFVLSNKLPPGTEAKLSMTEFAGHHA